jgi:hypothetical protein
MPDRFINVVDEGPVSESSNGSALQVLDVGFRPAPTFASESRPAASSLVLSLAPPS